MVAVGRVNSVMLLHQTSLRAVRKGLEDLPLGKDDGETRGVLFLAGSFTLKQESRPHPFRKHRC